MPLTPAQQDYIETIYSLEKNSGLDKIRITDIANKLGTKLPTVTRTVRKLKLILHFLMQVFQIKKLSKVK